MSPNSYQTAHGSDRPVGGGEGLLDVSPDDGRLAGGAAANHQDLAKPIADVAEILKGIIGT